MSNKRERGKLYAASERGFSEECVRSSGTKEEATGNERNCPLNRAVSERELSAVARGGHRPQRIVKAVSGGTFQYNGRASLVMYPSCL